MLHGAQNTKNLENWYYRHFLIRPGVNTMNQSTLDVMRQSWCTPENFETNYKIWADVQVEAGIAYLNPKFDPLVPMSEYIFFHKERLRDAADFDEMKAEACTGRDRRSKAERVVVVGEQDGGECVGARGAAGMTMVGGFYYDNTSTRPVGIVNLQAVTTEMLAEMPTVMIDGKKVQGVAIPAPGGSMTKAIIIQALKLAIFDRWDLTDGKMRTLTTDGVGVHMDPEFLEWLWEMRIRLCLRCPYSSSKTQPEDILLFWWVSRPPPRHTASRPPPRHTASRPHPRVRVVVLRLASFLY